MICISCNIDQPEEEFQLRSEKYRTGKRRTKCKSCTRESQRKNYEAYKTNSYFKFKANRVKARAKFLGVPCDLDEEYLRSIWTGFCPVTGIALNPAGGKTDPDAPELDRFDPAKGYTKGNVTFMSKKINRVKADVGIDELQKLLDWMKSFEN